MLFDHVILGNLELINNNGEDKLDLLNKKFLSTISNLLRGNLFLLIICSFIPITLKALDHPVSQSDFKFNFSVWPYPLYQEVSTRLTELSRMYPKIARTYSIGQSSEGRDLLVIEITNIDTGPGDNKSGIWMDGNLHAGETIGRQICMYFIEKMLSSYGNNPEVTRFIDTKTFYIMPMFDVDGGERVLTTHPAWPGHIPQDHRGKDLDGDGYITQMRIRDPKGEWYSSPIDSRLMLQVRDIEGGYWNYVPTDYGDNFYFKTRIPDIGWHLIKDPWEWKEGFEDSRVPYDQRYRIYTEGNSLEQGLSVDREPANFNRNWSAEWQPEEPGGGPFPFSLPEVYAVAKFITSHRNIFFYYNIHSSGAPRNYICRPPMNHPYESMPPEDNDFYTNLSAAYAAISNGCLMQNDLYSQYLMAGRYGDTAHGFSVDWAYMQVGIHALNPECTAAGKDYNGDGFVTQPETLRWNDEEKAGKYFAPWKPFAHLVLGEVEIGGWRGLPAGIDERLEKECQIHYLLLLHIAGLSPHLQIQNLTSNLVSDGVYHIVATLQNEGWLSTYVTRNALKIRQDFPILAKIQVIGGEVVDGKPLKKVGHILGKLAYIWRWGRGADESTQTVEWKIKAKTIEPIKISVEAWAHKAGKAQRAITIVQKNN